MADKRGTYPPLGDLAKAGAILEAMLYRRELPRGPAGDPVGKTGRHGQRTIAPLLDRGVLASDGPRAALRLAFPGTRASRRMPGLYRDKADWVSNGVED